MSHFLQLSLNDLRNIFREKILWVMFLVAPLLQFFIARLALPWLTGTFPVSAPYESLILMLMTLQVVAGISFVLSSMLLDERDEQIISAIRVLPLGAASFLGYRLLGGSLIAGLYAWFMLAGTGLISFGLWPALGGTLYFALTMPIVALILATFARNKVEGLAIFKGLNLILMLPAFSLFIDSAAKFLFAPVPLFWTFQFLSSAEAGAPVWGMFAAGVGLHLAFLYGLYRLFRKRHWKK